MPETKKAMKVAVVHEWFTAVAGSEKVVEQILCLFPKADLFAVYADPQTIADNGFLQKHRLETTFIQNLPGVRRKYRSYLPLMPFAIEQIDLSAYDLVISSSHAVSKGVLTGPDQLHLSYVHTPIRYAWDLQHQYLKESGLQKGIKSWLARWILHRIRLWDYRTAAGVDYFIANSNFIGRRIRKVYGRSSDVIYPPVDVNAFELCEKKQSYYLAASRLVPYKRMDLVVQAFAKLPEKQLLIVGDGPEMPRLRQLATANVNLLGYQDINQLKRYMQEARAFIFAAEEDFGIMPVEAQACGTPVIAFGKGGALETVVESEDSELCTGVFFGEQTVQSLLAAIERFERKIEPISAHVCRRQAERFSVDRFRSEFSAYVAKRMDLFRANFPQ